MRSRVSNFKASGFTLIELMVVMVMIAIMTAMIIPEMRGTFEGELLRATSRTLIDGFRVAYSHSVSRNEQHRLVIDNEEHRYRIEGFSSSAEGGRGFRLINVPGAEAKLDQRITIEIREPEITDEDEERESAPVISRRTRGQEVPENSITFYPDGRAQRVEIWLRDGSGFGLALKINPTTARVSVTKLEKELVQ